MSPFIACINIKEVTLYIDRGNCLYSLTFSLCQEICVKYDKGVEPFLWKSAHELKDTCYRWAKKPAMKQLDVEVSTPANDS